jgi:thioesterase domain-containing protein
MSDTPSAPNRDVAVATRALFTRVSRKPAPLVVPMNEAAASPRAQGPALFCIHSIVGVGVSDFLALARRFSGAVRVFGVQAPPQRIEADPDFGASVQQLADTYAEAIIEAQPAGPIVLAGWSAGAAIALEVARALRRRGREAAFVAAIEGAPEIPAAVVGPWDPRYWLGVVRNVPNWLKAGHGLEEPGVILRRWAKSFSGRLGRLAARRTPEVAPRLERLVSLERYPASQRLFMARLYDALMEHVPEPWDGPIVVYEARAVLTLPQYFERWRWVAPQAERARVAGNHVSIMHEPAVAGLAHDLEKRIAGVMAVRSIG